MSAAPSPQPLSHKGRGALKAVFLPLPLWERAGERGNPPLPIMLALAAGLAGGIATSASAAPFKAVLLLPEDD
ncbi:MAG: hypothetical protein RLZZ494_1508, partial [Pseudomonadota bacterium]